MNYIEIDVGEWNKVKEPLIVRALKKIIPSSNPDLEELIYEAQKWWLEYNEEGVPQREIGFNSNSEPVVLFPVGENFGFLIESSSNWLGYKQQSTEVANSFEKVWQNLWPMFKQYEKNT